MNNLISIFMNYKIERLVEYGVFLLDEDSPFIRKIFGEYFSVYVDNYYYHVFHTIDDGVYSDQNLKLELKGIMEEMLDDYLQYELVESNEDYQAHVHIIRKLKDFSYEVLKIDSLEISNREEVTSKVAEFVQNNSWFQKKIGDRLSKFTKLIRETFQTNHKLLSYEGHYFEVVKHSFEGHDDVYYYDLESRINILNHYRKSMVSRVYQEDGLAKAKLECMIQKISLKILKGFLEHQDLPIFIIELKDLFIKRGQIIDEVYDLIDNPLFRHYVTLGVSYNIYQSQKDAFLEDFHFACIQDFSHINDVYTKVDTISKDGIFDYTIVSDCKYKDRDFFLQYENEAMDVLVFEEE